MANKGNIVRWITVKGRRIPIYEDGTMGGFMEGKQHKVDPKEDAEMDKELKKTHPASTDDNEDDEEEGYIPDTKIHFSTGADGRQYITNIPYGQLDDALEAGFEPWDSYESKPVKGLSKQEIYEGWESGDIDLSREHKKKASGKDDKKSTDFKSKSASQLASIDLTKLSDKELDEFRKTVRNRANANEKGMLNLQAKGIEESNRRFFAEHPEQAGGKKKSVKVDSDKGETTYSGFTKTEEKKLKDLDNQIKDIGVKIRQSRSREEENALSKQRNDLIHKRTGIINKAREQEGKKSIKVDDKKVSVSKEAPAELKSIKGGKMSKEEAYMNYKAIRISKYMPKEKQAELRKLKAQYYKIWKG